MILIGELALWVALLMAAWSAITSFAGGKAGRADLILSGERGIYATCVLTVAAAAGLWTALLTHDFSFRYVAEHTTANLPVIYSFAAFWAGQSGALLLWSLLLVLCSAMTVFRNRKSDPELMPYVTGTLATILLLFLSAICLEANPYERLDWIPPEGVGMNPRLQNAGMVVHQPSLYLGYVSTAIPFAFGIAALATRRLDERWLAEVRRWSLVSWVFLSTGIMVGMWWTYIEPGSSSSWALHAVKNGSLVVWLTTTAFLCAIAIAERRGMISQWSVVLAASSFFVAMPGMTMMRISGLSGVQSFVRSPIGTWFTGVLVVAAVFTGYLVITRLRTVHQDAALDVIARPAARNLQAYGKYVVSVGAALLLLGVGGAALRKNHDTRLRTGESFTTRDPYGSEWTFAAQGVSHFQSLNRNVTAVAVQAVREGKRVGIISSETRQYVDSRGVGTFEPTTEAGIRATPRHDILITLGSLSDDEVAELRISFHPLMMWVWIGGALTILGVMMVMWPRPRRERQHGEIPMVEAR